MASDFNISILIELYGGLLTERQLEILKAYYDYDYSLTEIGENFGITRQGVSDTIKKAVASLENFEAKLCIKSKNDNQKAMLISLKESVETKEKSELLTQIDDILQTL